MTLWQLECDEPLSKTAYQQEMAERCASTMVELLNEGLSGSAGFRNEQGELQPLKPSDMAVLVNGLGEARSIRQALARRGVKSVYLSDKDKVFASPVAPQLDAWLRACAAPDDDRLLRTALATPVLGLDIATLDKLNEDELAWEGRVLQFRDYHRLWQRQGVLPLVRKIIHDFNVATRLLAWGPASDGERALTDLLHLGELLQHASQELDGEHALIRFLAEAIANPEGHGDTHKLRLESDADLVQVITIHKSKGLEYPLVFLPFICNHRPTKKDDSPLRWHDAEGRLRISLEADDEALATVDRERLGEDLRKLYVALTRARHATWLGMAPLKGGEGSATGQLLANGEALSPAGFSEALARLKGDCAAIEIAPAPPAHAQIVRQTERDDALGEARIPTRPAREHWWIASYSALRLSGEIVSVESASAPVRTNSPVKPHDSEAQRSGSLPEPATAMEATALEVLEEPRDSGQSEPLPSLHRFPRGPGPGTFLHGILEWAGEHGFSRVARDPALREETLARRCQVRGWQPWLNTLHAWFGTLLAAPLPLPNGAGSLRLEALTSYQVEMEFWFASRQVDTRRLDALVSAYTLASPDNGSGAGLPRPALDADTLNGMLKGFIDLVFEFDGRYYVADWKSNHLGPDDSAYRQEAMRQAVAAKRYDLQYALYLLALHRLLKARLPGYDYDRHIGGSLTVFLRGRMRRVAAYTPSAPAGADRSAGCTVPGRRPSGRHPHHHGGAGMSKRSKHHDDATPDLFADLGEEPAGGSQAADEGAEPEPPQAAQGNVQAALHDTQALFALLDRWVERGWLRALDRALASFFQREVSDAPPLLLLAAALASHQLGRGHVCLDLAQTLAAPDLALSLPPEGDDLSDPPPLPSDLLAELDLATWRDALYHPALVADGNEPPGNTPLVRSERDGNVRLYLRRYWQYEQDIRGLIGSRLTATTDAEADTVTLARALAALFTPGHELDWQQAACALASRSRFAVITGGPGTGKTTTVVKLLALLQALALGETAPAGAAPRPLRIRLAAPTGKAAARLNESIAKQVQGLSLVELAAAVGQQGVDISTLRDSIPTEVTTLHRLLGSRPDTRHFRHHAGNPLTLDALVIDEASMVDIEMMAAVLTALPPRARLILLGDKDQLASVEAGAVLGDLCQRAEGGHYTPATCDWLQRVTGTPIPEQYKDEGGQPLDQAIAMLRVSHRFDAKSGIGQLAEAVNRPLGSGQNEKEGQKEKKRAVREIFQQGYADIARLALADADDPALDRLVVNGNPAGFTDSGEGRHDRRGEPIAPPRGYAHYLDVMQAVRPTQPYFGEGEARQSYDDWARQVLAAHGHFQLLCALRKGPGASKGLTRASAAPCAAPAGSRPATWSWNRAGSKAARYSLPATTTAWG